MLPGTFLSRKWIARTSAGVLSMFLSAVMVDAQENAGGSDLAERVRIMERIKAQQVESDYVAIVKQIEVQAKTDPIAAAESYKNLVTELESITTLPKDRKDFLLRSVREKADKISRSGKSSDAASSKPVIKSDDRTLMDKAVIEYRLKSIGELQDKGEGDKAKREVLELAKQFPTNESVRAAVRIVTAGQQLQASRLSHFDKEKGYNAVAQEMMQSSTPPATEVDFPKNWTERTKGRNNAVAMSAKEKEILKALSSPMTVQYRGKRLEEVVDQLQQALGHPILLDQAALKEAEVSYDTQITMSAKGVTLRTVLRKVFAEFGMTYIIKDEMLQIVSAETARETMIVRRYYVGDVLAGMTDPTLQSALFPTMPAPTTLTPGFVSGVPTGAQTQTALVTNARTLIDMIQSSVDSRSWKQGGGEGTITYHAPSMSLIVKQSAEVHAMLGGGVLGK